MKALQCATLLHEDDCPSSEVRKHAMTPLYYGRLEFIEEHKDRLNPICEKCDVFKPIDQAE